MRKKLLVIGLFPLLTFTWSCKKASKNKEQKNNTLHTHEVVDVESSWEGEYSGVLPCASCPGIETTIKLNSNGTYQMFITYQESDLPTESTKGNFTWSNDSKTKLIIKENKYLLEDHKLVLLDREGNKVEGSFSKNYILNKK